MTRFAATTLAPVLLLLAAAGWGGVWIWLALAYLTGTAAVYAIATAAGLWRRQDVATTAIEAQCAAIGNTGFLGVPMLAVLLGQAPETLAGATAALLREDPAPARPEGRHEAPRPADLAGPRGGETPGPTS